MKPAQWAVAAVLLAAMVFAITFAMNYLGNPAKHGDVRTGGPEHELSFLSSKVAPFGAALEDEVHARNYRDFWFTNPNDAAVVVGVKKLGCRCSAVELCVVPPEARPMETAAASCVAARAGGPLTGMGSFFLALATFGVGKEVPAVELLHKTDSFTVPPHAVGWLRLRWRGDRVELQELKPELWMNNKDTGVMHTLTVTVMHHEPIRVNRTLAMGTMNDEDLAGGVTRHIYVWSSTRRAFKLKAEPTAKRGSDPLEVGTPVPLSESERLALEKENNEKVPTRPETASHGPVLSGYKVPVTLRAMSPDGKTPADIGPLRRGVKLSSPDVDHDPILIAVTGRVRGLVELGADDEGGTLDFGQFARRDGARVRLTLQSSSPDVKLVFDRSRTPEYLTATLKGPENAGEFRRAWTLQAQVVKGKASGHFPRPEDPLYEDSAIYLRAEVPGKPAIPIRVAVRGTANER